MSTKEIYAAHVNARMEASQQMLSQMDEAINACIDAEINLQSNIQIASHELFRRRLQLILCKRAALLYKPVELPLTEAEQLEALAKAVGCPRLNAEMTKPSIATRLNWD